MKASTARASEVREVMDIRQASDYLGISPDTLYKYASESFIPAFKLGNRWRFKKSRLDEWMDHQSGPAAVCETQGSCDLRDRLQPLRRKRNAAAARSGARGYCAA